MTTLLFVDTSALVKVFVDEVGSSEMRMLAGTESPHLVSLLDLTRVELYSALKRRERQRQLPLGSAARHQSTLNDYIASSYVMQNTTASVMDRACALIDRHTLRAADAMQLAGAAELAAARRGSVLTFVSSDRELLAAARSEGLRTIDPASSEQLS